MFFFPTLLLTDDREVRVYVGLECKSPVLPESNINGLLYSSYTSPVVFCTDLFWREQDTRYYQTNIGEGHNYKGDGIIIWGGISSGCHPSCMCFMEEL